MAVPSNGPISIQDLVDEWGDLDGAPSEFSEYYAGGDNVDIGASGLNGAIPTSGELSLSDFLGGADASVLSFEEHHSPPNPVYFSPQDGKVGSDFAMSDYSAGAYGMDSDLAYYIVGPSGGGANYTFGSSILNPLIGGAQTIVRNNLGQYHISAVSSSKTLYAGFSYAPTTFSHVESGSAASWGLRICSEDSKSITQETKRIAVTEIGKIYFYDFDLADTGNELHLNASFTENTASQEIGYSIAMDLEGETCVASLVNGTIKTYTRSGEVWSAGVVADLDATVDLTTTDGVTAEIYAVRISGDGNTLAVGYNGVLLSGPRVAIYERVANAWVYRTNFSRTLGQFSNTAPGVGQPNLMSPDRFWYNSAPLEYLTRNDWLDVDYTGTRVIAGDAYALAESLTGANYQGKVNILDKTSTNWATYNTEVIFPPAAGEHTSALFTDNAPWSQYNFGASLRLNRNGSYMIVSYYPSGHSGSTTNEVYVHTAAYGLTRPTLQELPTVADQDGTDYRIIDSVTDASRMFYSHKGYFIDHLLYDSATTELKLRIKSPVGAGLLPSVGFLTSVSIRGDWGSGEQTKIFYTNTASVTTEGTSEGFIYINWTWSVTVSEQFIATNTYHIKTT